MNSCNYDDHFTQIVFRKQIEWSLLVLLFAIVNSHRQYHHQQLCSVDVRLCYANLFRVYWFSWSVKWTKIRIFDDPENKKSKGSSTLPSSRSSSSSSRVERMSLNVSVGTYVCETWMSVRLLSTFPLRNTPGLICPCLSPGHSTITEWFHLIKSEAFWLDLVRYLSWLSFMRHR